MMFIQIIPVTRRGANTPPETGAKELLRVDLIQRACPATLAGGFPCLQLVLDNGQTVHCTGTINDLLGELYGPAEESEEPKLSEVANEPDEEVCLGEDDDSK